MTATANGASPRAISLVTGGGGFLGRHIVAQLLARGDRVRVLGRRDYPDLAARGVELIRGDLNDAGALRRACQGAQTVFHVAAQTGIAGRYATYRQTNVLGTQAVLSACRSEQVPALVYTSTPSVVYGRTEILDGDETLPYPAEYLTAYAATKAEAERQVLAANGPELRTCALRPHLVWGPGDTNLLPRIAARARAGRLRRIGAGTNRISVSYVENAAAAHLVAAQRLRACAWGDAAAPAGKAYFINEPEPVNCWDFINRLLAAMGIAPVTGGVPAGVAYAAGAVLEQIGRLRPDWEPPMTRFLALQLSTSHSFRIDRARRELGWEPAVSVEEGLARVRQEWQARQA